MSPLRIIQQDKKDPVLFIHGLGANASIWDQVDIPSRLMVELYGHGKQEHFPPNLSITQTVSDLYTFLKAHKYQGLKVVGHGLGGLIALQLAHEHAAMLKSLILIDTPSWQTGWKLAHRIMLHVVKDDFKDSIKHHVEALCQKEDLLDGLISMGQSTQARAYYLYLRDMFAHDYRSVLKDIDIPVRGIFTRTLVKNERGLSSIVKKFAYDRLKRFEAVWMKDSGHFAMLEKAADLTRLINDFKGSK